MLFLLFCVPDCERIFVLPKPADADLGVKQRQRRGIHIGGLSEMVVQDPKLFIGLRDGFHNTSSPSSVPFAELSRG